MPDAPMKEEMKSWVMVVLTFVFVALYAAAALGSFPRVDENSVFGKLEPIIFVIVGYYFGRLPATQNEKTLKGEIQRKAEEGSAKDQKIDEKDQKLQQKDKEVAQQSEKAATAEQKLKDVKAALSTSLGAAPQRGGMLAGSSISASEQSGIQHNVAAALNIINV